jgi:hypothetical protein
MARPRMKPPLARRRERAAQDRATEAEVDRLTAMPSAALAVELTEAFGSDGPRSSSLTRRTPNLIELTEWMLREHARPGRHLMRLSGPVRDSMHLLEGAGLIEWYGSEMVGARARLRATPLGELALAERTVADYVEDDSAS